MESKKEVAKCEHKAGKYYNDFKQTLSLATCITQTNNKAPYKRYELHYHIIYRLHTSTRELLWDQDPSLYLYFLCYQHLTSSADNQHTAECTVDADDTGTELGPKRIYSWNNT